MTGRDAMAAIRNLEASGLPHKQAVMYIRILWEVRTTAKANGVYNAIDAMRRLEASGFPRQQAETLADVLVDVFTDARELSFLKVA